MRITCSVIETVNLVYSIIPNNSAIIWSKNRGKEEKRRSSNLVNNLLILGSNPPTNNQRSHNKSVSITDKNKFKASILDSRFSVKISNWAVTRKQNKPPINSN